MAAQNSQLSNLQQQVRTRLSFLGMPQGDVHRFVELASKVAGGGAEVRASQTEMRKLGRALSREVGKPRADLFVKWLVDRIPEVSKIATAHPSDQSVAQPSNCKPECSQTGVLLEHLRPTSEAKANIARASDISKNENVTPNRPNKQVSLDGETVFDEAWVEVKAKDGKTYFWDRLSNSCKWALPAGIRAKWVSHKSAEGRTYYCNRDGGATVWTMPPLQTLETTPPPTVPVVPQAPEAATPTITGVRAASRPLSEMHAGLENVGKSDNAQHVNVERPHTTFRMASPSKQHGGADCNSLRQRSRSPRRVAVGDADLKLQLEKRLTAIKAAIKSGAAEKGFESVTVFEHVHNRRAMCGGA